MNSELNQSIITLKGIGEETADSFAEMKIFTIVDLLEYFPYRYEDYSLRDLTEVQHDEKITVEGKVHSEPSKLFWQKEIKIDYQAFCGLLLN